MEDFEYERKKKKRIRKGSLAVILVCVMCLVAGAAGGFLFARLNPYTLVLTDTIYDELYHKITTNILDTTENEITNTSTKRMTLTNLFFIILYYLLTYIKYMTF